MPTANNPVPLPNAAIPTRQQLIDAAVCGLLGSVFNTDGSTSVRLIQVSDDGKLLVNDAPEMGALLETQRTSIADKLQFIAVELRVISLILAQAHGITDDLDKLRYDVQLNPQQS